MTLRDLLLRLRALATPRRVERELDEELAFHIERETQKHLADGMSPADARARALARFGSVPLVADQCRDTRGIGSLTTQHATSFTRCERSAVHPLPRSQSWRRLRSAWDS